MRISLSSTSVLFPLLYAFFSQTALLPATISLRNGTLLGLPVIGVPGPIPAAGVPPIAVSSRSIVLAFTDQGSSIPKSEVVETLIDADQSIADLATDHPNQRITNDRFEYRRPNGHMLISLKTYLGEEITWRELVRILQGLYKYMTGGMGAEKTHYQTLEFELEASGQKKPNIGFGVVWYFDPIGNQVQKRGTLPFPYLTHSPSFNETAPRLPNTSGAEDVQETINFSVPKTSLILSFYDFGQPILARSVQATLQGAMAAVRPFLNGATENAPMEDDAFRWILSSSPEVRVPVAVTVYAYHGCRISWRQLFDVLYGLFAFTTTFGTDLQDSHYQGLLFRILDGTTSKRLGVGTISYFRSETGQLAKRVGTRDDGIPLRRPSVSNVSSLDLGYRPIVYPVANTDITLTFTFFGATAIPPTEIFSALMSARRKINSMVTRDPNMGIAHRYKDISISTRIVMNIIVYDEKSITFGELDQVLEGLLQFCRDDRAHDRVLVFEIDVAEESRGRVGFGTLLYVPPDQSHVTTLQ